MITLQSKDANFFFVSKNKIKKDYGVGLFNYKYF